MGHKARYVREHLGLVAFGKKPEASVIVHSFACEDASRAAVYVVIIGVGLLVCIADARSLEEYIVLV